MEEVKERIADVTKRLRECGYRMTPQRAAIINTLVTSEHHPSAEGVYEAVRESFPMITLATVYKAIGVLKELGELAELHVTNGGAHFDARRPYPHPHLVCACCGDVIDVHVANVEQIVLEVAESTDYEIVGHQLYFWGLCPRCRDKS